MDSHLDIALVAGGHDGLQEILEVFPQLLLGHGGVGLEQLIELVHPLRLPAGEGHVVLLGEAHDVVGHGLVVVLDHVLLVKQSGGAVADRMEQVGAGPVKDGHEIVADDLHAILCQIADADLVVFDQGVPGGQTDLNVIVNVDGFHHLGIEAVGVNLVNHFLDFRFFPDFAGHLVMQGPDDAGHAGNLLNVGEAHRVISLTIPAPTHFHRHIFSLHL